MAFRAVRDVVENAPAFAQAYPRFDSFRAQRELRFGRTVCVWVQRRRRLGHFVIQDTFEMPDGRQWVRGKFQVVGGPPLFQHVQAEFLFQLDLVPGKYGVPHWYVWCPQCGDRKRMLVWGREWGCAQCHRLLARSQVIPKRTTPFEKRDALRREVTRGRHPGKWSKTFEQKLARLAELDGLLGKSSPAFASSAQHQVVTAYWTTVQDDWDWQSHLEPRPDAHLHSQTSTSSVTESAPGLPPILPYLGDDVDDL